MTRIHEGLEDRDFDMPSSVEKPVSAQKPVFFPDPDARLSQSILISPVFPPNTVISISTAAAITMKRTIIITKIRTPIPMQQLKRFQAQLRTVLTAPTLTILTIPMTVPIIPVMILTIPEPTTTPVVMTAAMITAVIPVAMTAAMTPAKIR